jgi:hypothetical protein
MGPLILFGRIEVVCLLQGLKVKIYRLRRPEVLSLVPLIPLQKLPVRFSPGGLVKTPHILLFFFLDILLPLFYIRLILKQVLIILAVGRVLEKERSTS